MLTRGQARTLAAGVGISLALSGCTSSSDVGRNSTDQNSDGLRALQTAPARPPSLSVEGQALSPAYYDWIIDGQRSVFKAAPNEDEVDLPEVVEPARGDILIEILSGSLPADFTVVLFSELAADGTPRQQGSHSIDCLHGDPACQLEAQGDELKATVDLGRDAKIVVVQLLYAGMSPTGDGLSHMNASWGWRIRDQRAD